MKLKIISTGSKGNAYLLQDRKGNMLLLEAGVQIDKIKIAADHQVTDIDACLITHEHLDHCKSAKKVLEMGIPIFASEGTHKAMNTANNRMAKTVKPFDQAHIGGRWKVIPFDVKHDAAEPFGFLIHHEEMGNVLFATDTYYIEYQFPDLNNMIVEANYDEDILMAKTPGFLANRIVKSHMSIETMIKFLKDTDTKKVNNLVVCHLSDTNSNELNFTRRIKNETGIYQVHIANNGQQIDFDKTPF